MIKRELFHVSVLAKRLLILLGLFFLCRLLFFAFNYQLFPHMNAWEFTAAMLYGLRYDISAILIINMVFILMHIVPNPWREGKWYQSILKWQFYLVNGTFLIIEAGDFIWYRYGQERASTHILGLRNDIVSLIPQIILDFWYVILLGVGFFWSIDWLYRKTHYHRSMDLRMVLNYPLQTGFALVIFALAVIGARGGLQADPLSPSTATNVVAPNAIGLVTNSTFTIIHSMLHREMEPIQYMPVEEADQLFSPYQSIHSSVQLPEQPNVVVLLLESFSQEYISTYSGQPGYTPNLDSLLQKSLVFEQAYANGKHSVDVLPSVAMGLPPLMTDPFIASSYGKQPFRALGHYLDTVGYNTYFFHGGNNGTLGLDSFTIRAGFDGYFGRNEYGNNEDFDGNWGIFDQPFLRYMADQLDTLPKPFTSICFTLSSHHPFTMPPSHASAYLEYEEPMHRALRYADEALGQFFAYAAQKPWFNNTIFLITADHTGQIYNDSYKNKLGHFKVPIALYDPQGRWIGRDTSRIAQQVDLLPTILDIAGYEGDYFGFGRSLFEPNLPGLAVNFRTDIYQLVWQDYVLHFNGKRVVGWYNAKEDPELNNNLMAAGSTDMANATTLLKAIIQQFNHALVFNLMAPA